MMRLTMFAITFFWEFVRPPWISFVSELALSSMFGKLALNAWSIIYKWTTCLPWAHRPSSSRLLAITNLSTATLLGSSECFRSSFSLCWWTRGNFFEGRSPLHQGKHCFSFWRNHVPSEPSPSRQKCRHRYFWTYHPPSILSSLVVCWDPLDWN